MSKRSFDLCRCDRAPVILSLGGTMVSGGSSNVWIWIMGALLIAAIGYGLGRTLFGPRPSLAAVTSVAVALSLAVAVVLELLSYGFGKTLHFALSLFLPVAYLGIFSFVLGRYIRRVRPSVILAIS